MVSVYGTFAHAQKNVLGPPEQFLNMAVGGYNSYDGFWGYNCVYGYSGYNCYVCGYDGYVCGYSGYDGYNGY